MWQLSDGSRLFGPAARSFGQQTGGLGPADVELGSMTPQSYATSPLESLVSSSYDAPVSRHASGPVPPRSLVDNHIRAGVAATAQTPFVAALRGPLTHMLHRDIASAQTAAAAQTEAAAHYRRCAKQAVALLQGYDALTHHPALWPLQRILVQAEHAGARPMVRYLSATLVFGSDGLGIVAPRIPMR